MFNIRRVYKIFQQLLTSLERQYLTSWGKRSYCFVYLVLHKKNKTQFFFTYIKEKMQSAYEYTFAASLILDQIYEQNVKSFLVTYKGRKSQQKISRHCAFIYLWGQNMTESMWVDLAM